jgi:hypothetical protein
MKQTILVVLTTIFTTTLFGQIQIETNFFSLVDGEFIKSEKSMYSCINKLNEENLVVEKQNTSTNSKGKVTYEYNELKQKIAENDFSPRGDLTRRRTYEYNSKGNLTIMKSNWINLKGDKVEYREEFGYNNRNELIIKTCSSNQYGIEMVYTYEITKKNNQKKIVEHKQNFGRELDNTTTLYNEYGLELKEITKTGEKSYQYEFDEIGNWTVKKIYKDGKLIGEIRKKIIG